MSRSVLVIGGTRNLGHFVARRFNDAGDSVAVLNRGVTPDQLPPAVERIRADRTRPAELAAAIRGRDFDVVVDTALYTGVEADRVTEILRDRVGHYVFISTGQVYLVRTNLDRPFRESDYAGAVMSAPPLSSDHADWTYGVEKRAAEDRLMAAHQAFGFPLTVFRLPMVHSQRDHYDRVRNCLARLMDGGPLLVPEGPRPALRHVWVHDVVAAIERVADGRVGVGRSYNLSQNETVSLTVFLTMLGRLIDQQVHLVPIPRQQLSDLGLLPSCAPFSGRWMSELDNSLSIRELGIEYTPLPTVAEALVADFLVNRASLPSGYSSRSQELTLAGQFKSLGEGAH